MIDPHISDAELLCMLDGELDSQRSKTVADHLVHCWDCRARQRELEGTIAEVVQAHRTHWTVPDTGAGPAARLKAGIASTAATDRQSLPGWKFATAIVVLGVCVTVLRIAPQPELALPDPKLTPGSVRAVSREQLCSANRPSAHISTALAGRVFGEYGISHPRPKAYEVDFLITPALGGADDIHNLWPQPYSGSPWTAPVKDALETYLVSQVCDGSLGLETAQHEIATNWIAAYRKYFHTARPLQAHLVAATDDPWE